MLGLFSVTKTQKLKNFEYGCALIFALSNKNYVFSHISQKRMQVSLKSPQIYMIQHV
jgi:hypothetical protein